MDHSYQPGTPGLKPGCAVAALVGAPLVIIAIGGAATGQCVPDTRRLPGWALIIGAIAIASLCGLIVGLSVNRSRRD